MAIRDAPFPRNARIRLTKIEGFDAPSGEARQNRARRVRAIFATKFAAISERVPVTLFWDANRRAGAGGMALSLRGWGVCCAILGPIFLPSLAFAHPHVWVTVRSQILFSPAGEMTAVVHDWTFDEMYSAFATQNLAPPGQLVKRKDFAQLAKENSGQLAQIGYFTVVKIGGKQVDFGNVTDYWMEERPDHLVTFHVVLPLKTPAPPGKFATMMVSDPEFFVDFEFDDKDPVQLENPPTGCSLSITHPRPLDVEDSKKLSESFFTNLSPGAGFGFKLASRAIVACP
jgi:ABC-type uncharacterized transport system substrate-binding protein